MIEDDRIVYAHSRASVAVLPRLVIERDLCHDLSRLLTYTLYPGVGDCSMLPSCRSRTVAEGTLAFFCSPVTLIERSAQKAAAAAFAATYLVLSGCAMLNGK
jgi:hypothetical protein